MISQKQLKFVLGEIQELQKKNFGSKIGISIATGCEVTEFIVIVEYNFKKTLRGDLISNERTFEFNNKLTEDQCVDLLKEVETLVKEYA